MLSQKTVDGVQKERNRAYLVAKVTVDFFVSHCTLFHLSFAADNCLGVAFAFAGGIARAFRTNGGGAVYYERGVWDQNFQLLDTQTGELVQGGRRFRYDKLEPWHISLNSVLPQMGHKRSGSSTYESDQHVHSLYDGTEVALYTPENVNCEQNEGG